MTPGTVVQPIALPTRVVALALVLVLAVALTACDDAEDPEQDPRAALREAVRGVGEHEGLELVFGVQLDEDARASALEDGEMSDEELGLLAGSTLTVRSLGGGEEPGESEIVLVVGDETILTVRALPEYETYALVDLPAMERVADTLDAGDDFRETLTGLEQAAAFLGLDDALSAAREGQWIRLAGLEEALEMAEARADEGERPDEEEMDRLSRAVGQRLLAFLEDDDVEVSHVGSDDVGDRIRVSAQGAPLRELLGDLLDEVEAVAPLTDAGTGTGPRELRAQVDRIPDDVTLSADAWVDGGELRQVAVDVFEIGRSVDAEDVPPGEFLVTIGIAEFTGPVEAPETDATLDVMDAMGSAAGAFGSEFREELQMEDAPAAPPDAAPDEDFCLTDEQIELFLEQLPEEDRRQIDEADLEEMLGVPVC